MSEFSNRMSAQRDILQIVNERSWGGEALFGLSSKAIERWLATNEINPQAQIAQLVHEASSQLLFLATKSQEQITEDYEFRSNEVARITRKIQKEVSTIFNDLP